MMLTAVVLTTAGLLHADDTVDQLEEDAFKQAAAIAAPSVVRIDTVGGLDRISGATTGTAPTTGVIVSADGYILSSMVNFVSRPSSVVIQLPDGRRFPARQVASDRMRMLTLLRIDADDLDPIRTAPSSEVRVGQWSLALGRTYESSAPSVSVGVVSALNRIWGKAIQTDANVSPTNYGGPLIDIRGRAIGLVVPLSPDASGAMAGVQWYDSGIGFAIPMDDALDAFDRLTKGEDLHRGLMGVSVRGQNLYAGQPVIDRVRYDSPAEKAGLQREDVIVAIDGAKIERPAQLRHALGNRYAGSELTVVVERGGKRIERQMTLVAELPPYESGFLGILPARSAKSDPGQPGVVVRHVFTDSPAARAGIRKRDRIVRMNDTDVDGSQVLLDLVGRARPEEKASLVIESDNERRTITLGLASIPIRVPGQLESSTIPPPAENVGNDNQESELRIGRFNQRLEAHQHGFWAWVPEDYNPDYEYGLMVWLHPAGDTMEAAVLQDWQAVAEQRGIILLGPLAERPTGWTPNEAEFVVAATEYITENYSVDRSRVFLNCMTGSSPVALHLLFDKRDIFRAVSVASPLPFPLIAPPENRPEDRLQFYFACQQQHPSFRFTRGLVGALRSMKFPVVLTSAEGQGNDPYPSPEIIDEIGRWADSLDRI